MLSNYLGDSLIEQNAANVLVFGAVGDGVADDTEALQNALNSKRENGGAIYFPALIYKVSKPLVFYSNQLLFFEPGATIKQGASIDALLLSDGGVAQGGYDGVHDSVIVGATFDGSDFTTNMSLVGICHSRNVKFVNCIFKNAYGTYHNIEINSSFGTVIDGCDFEGSRKTGASAELIQIDAAINTTVYPWPTKNDGTVCKNIEIKSCVFHDDSISPAIGNHTSAVHKYISIHDCYFEGFSSYGTIRFDGGGEDIDIYDNTFVNCVTGIATSGATYYIRNNRFVGATTAIAGSASVAHGNMINGTYTA